MVKYDNLEVTKEQLARLIKEERNILERQDKRLQRSTLPKHWWGDINSCQYYVRWVAPETAQYWLEHEYKRPEGPRWTLIQWLKRHRLHNPTVRVIHNR